VADCLVSSEVTVDAFTSLMMANIIPIN
jgi:hypothetical protein